MDDIEQLLEGVVGVVEATRFEKSALWKEFKASGSKQEWKDGNFGKGLAVGEVDAMPVLIALHPATIMGKKVLFVEATSQVVDHRTIKNWLKSNLPPTAFENNDPRKRMRFVDADNFYGAFPAETSLESA